MVKRSVAELAAAVADSAYYWEPAGPFQWSQLFVRGGPVELDVGCGKGLFLAKAAAQWPQRKFLGIEVSRRYALYAARRLLVQSLPNARVAKADARPMLESWVPEQSVAVLHVYFPDPWWKRRHRRRRLFTEAFVTAALRVLEPGGELRIATDVHEYFQVMTELVARSSRFEPLPAPPPRTPEHDLDYLTNFERKYRQSGRAVFYARFRSLS